MLDLLSRILGPHRAVSVYVFLQNRGLAILAAIGFAAIIGFLFLSTDHEEHRHEAYMTVNVISTAPVGTDISTGLIASVRLPDGEAVTITTTEGEVAATVTATACVEKRIFVDSGDARYRLKLPRYCAGD